MIKFIILAYINVSVIICRSILGECSFLRKEILMLFLMSNSIANLEKEKYNKYKKVTYIHFEIFFSENLQIGIRILLRSNSMYKFYKHLHT